MYLVVTQVEIPLKPDISRSPPMNAIPPEDLEITAYNPQPPGGQHVSSPLAVKITHLPSGLTAICANERSQHRNKAIAMDMILGGLTSPHYRGNP